MGRFLNTLIIVGTASLALSPDTAEQVYKWVDQQGLTHYSEQPPADKEAATIKINRHHGESKPQQLQPEETDHAVQEPEPQPQVDIAPSKQQMPTQQQQIAQKQNCATARNKLRALQNAGRVRQLDSDSGEYIYLPDEVKLAQIQQMSDYLRNKCRG